jgi:hypothetical protein
VSNAISRVDHLEKKEKVIDEYIFSWVRLFVVVFLVMAIATYTLMERGEPLKREWRQTHLKRKR